MKPSQIASKIRKVNKETENNLTYNINIQLIGPEEKLFLQIKRGK